MTLKDELIAEYNLFLEGCRAECRTPDDKTSREYAGMLLKLFGPEAIDSLDEDAELEPELESIDKDVRELLLEVIKDLPECTHDKCKPKRGFNAEKAKTMNPHQVRNSYPPFTGKCPDCGYQTIVFASKEHEAASEDSS